MDAEACRALYESCIGVLFFGVPHKGLDSTSLKEMVQGRANGQLLADLALGSGYLSNLAEDLGRFYESIRNCTVVSFIETTDTSVVEVRSINHSSL
jgi:hypothetical protein